MNALRGLWASGSSQALVEAALCLPLLVLFVAGVIDLGSAVGIRHALGERRAGGRAIRLAELDERGRYQRHGNGRDERCADRHRDRLSYYKCADGSSQIKTAANH
jgi:hypothetical protein